MTKRNTLDPSLTLRMTEENMKINFSADQKDALKEMATIGAGNAATALSQLLRKAVTIEVPKVEIRNIEDVPEIMGGAERLVTAVYLQLLGDVSGVILLSSTKEETMRFAGLLLGNESAKKKILNEMAQSALKEATSIISGAFVGALAKLLNFRLLISAPGFVQDMAGAILDDILVETSKEADYAIILHTELYIVQEKIRTLYFVVPDVQSLDKMWKALGV